MKKELILKTILLLSFLGTIITACSPKISMVTAWQNEPLSIASAESWSAPTATDKRSKLDYALSNDRENLYIILQTADPATRLRIIRAGMELEIQTPENEKNPGTIKYPLPEERITLFDGIGRQEGARDRPRQDPTEMFNRVMASQTELELSGFSNHPNGRVPLQNEGGINIGVDMDSQGVITYKALIPLHTFLDESPAGISAQNHLLTITVNAIDMPGGPPGNFTGPGMPGGGRTSPNDPGYRGGASGPRPGGGYMIGVDLDRLTRSETIKINFKLTSQ
ncbi:MAG: hypothetical protein K0B09_10895 [Bacteroidales bacterium]|nr:hypothetical protein [Bacteroidales bacterium]